MLVGETGTALRLRGSCGRRTGGPGNRQGVSKLFSGGSGRREIRCAMSRRFITACWRSSVLDSRRIGQRSPSLCEPTASGGHVGEATAAAGRVDEPFGLTLPDVTLLPIILPLVTTTALLLVPEHVTPTALTIHTPSRLPPPPPLFREDERRGSSASVRLRRAAFRPREARCAGPTPPCR